VNRSVDTCECLGNEWLVQNVAHQKLNLCVQPRRPLAWLMDRLSQEIEGTYLIPQSQQLVRRMGPEEARSTCNQDQLRQLAGASPDDHCEWRAEHDREVKPQ
jgi:hypothetical protein